MKRFSSQLSNQMEVMLYAVWGVIAVLWTITAFQVQAALLALGLFVIKTPFLVPYGWNTSTLHGLNRFIIFVVGSLWLGIVVFSQDYLREALEEQHFLDKVKQMLLIIGGTYLVSGGLMYLLSFVLQ